MDRRRLGRWIRRLVVRFWSPGEEKALPGHTVNLSRGGMFIGTNRPPRSGTRLRIEVLDPQRGFVVEGVVTHSHNVTPELRRIQESGMGIRFLSPDELVAPLISHAAQANAAESEAAAADPSPPPPAPAGLSFVVRLDNPQQFLEVFERDVRRGGLFVATRQPAPLSQVVNLELFLPPSGSAPETVKARVVQRFDPAEHRGAASSQAAGMGVELLERDAVVARLWRLARDLKSRPG